jgi:ligand-binding SRPBCC domain-containing protein
LAAFESTTEIPATCDAVWQRVTTPEGINYELWPVMRMTVPKALRGVTLHDIELRTRIGRSWFLLFGFLPFDFDDIVIAELGPGYRFRETSTMLSIARWEHERVLNPRNDHCDLTDRVKFEMRRPMRFIPGMERAIAEGLKALFDHRHRRLAAWFNDQSGALGSPTTGEGGNHEHNRHA